jgi:hypothetical protein
MTAISESWPKVRVGQRVRLRKNGAVGEVVGVRRARDVLRCLTELQAILLGPKCQALYGSGWLEIYYEADVRVGDSLVVSAITPNDIEQVLPDRH